MNGRKLAVFILISSSLIICCAIVTLVILLINSKNASQYTVALKEATSQLQHEALRIAGEDTFEFVDIDCEEFSLAAVTHSCMLLISPSALEITGVAVDEYQQQDGLHKYLFAKRRQVVDVEHTFQASIRNDEFDISQLVAEFTYTTPAERREYRELVHYTGTGNKITSGLLFDDDDIKVEVNVSGNSIYGIASFFSVWLKDVEGRVTKDRLIVADLGTRESAELSIQRITGEYHFEVQAVGNWSIRVSKLTNV